MLDVPAVGFPPRTSIVAKRQRGVAFDGDVIVVVEPDQLTKPGMTSEGPRLVGDSFHHVSIAGDEVHVMVEDFLIAVEYRGHVCFADSHADGVANTLTER